MKPMITVISPSFMDIFIRGKLTWNSANTEAIELNTFPGGSGRNIAEALSRLNVETTLITITGDDLLSRNVLAYTRNAGVKIYNKSLSSTSLPVYIAFKGTNEELLHEVDANIGILDFLDGAFFNKYIRRVKNIDYLVINSDVTNDLIDAATLFCRQHSIPLILQIGSAEGAHKAKSWLNKLDGIFLNIKELSIVAANELKSLKDALRYSNDVIASHSIKFILVSNGDQGVAFTNGTTEYLQAAIPPTKLIQSVVGAGDVMCAAFLFGKIRGFDVPTCLKLSMAGAALSLITPEAVPLDLNEKKLYEICEL